MEGLRKTINSLSKDTNFLEQNLKLGSPDTKQENYINLQIWKVQFPASK
jgi:hypothetical protein